jgi:hypothetical protein
MRRFLSLACAALLLGSCATEYEVPAAVAGPLDATVRANGLSPRKIKITGPLTLQVGGTNNTATSTAIGKAKAPVAAAPNASATESRTKTGPPWWVYAGLATLGLAGGFMLRGKLKIPLPF